MSKGRLIQGVKHLLPDTIVKSAKGSHVTTECGRKFLDFTCGIGVINLGHSHPAVTESVTAACENLVHAQQNIMRHRPMVDLIDRLSSLEVSKKANLDSWFLWNSGAEAVEAAIKLARQTTGKPNVIVANLGYHGRTYGTMAMTTSGVVYRSGFGPLMGGVFVAPFPYLGRGPYAPPEKLMHNSESWEDSVLNMSFFGAASGSTARTDVARCLHAIELMLRTQTSPSETACILIEPVLGEGGYLPCPPGYLAGLRDICDRHGILLIADEVQTGFGRTGSMFAVEWIDGGVQPDILVCAKGIANGFPLSAIGTRNELSAKLSPGGMGGTYGGNAVSCAAALAVLDVFEKENVLETCLTRENEVRFRMNYFFNHEIKKGVLRELRGRGLMLGVEFETQQGSSFGETAASIAKACHERDLLVLSCGPYDTIRLIPPLNITSKDLNDGLDIFFDAVQSVVTKT